MEALADVCAVDSLEAASDVDASDGASGATCPDGSAASALGDGGVHRFVDGSDCLRTLERRSRIGRHMAVRTVHEVLPLSGRWSGVQTVYAGGGQQTKGQVVSKPPSPAGLACEPHR